MKIEPSQNIGMDTNFGGMRDAVMSMTCVIAPIGCGRQISPTEFSGYSPVQRQEYRQSGWCVNCQAIVFAAPEDEEDECNCNHIDTGIGILVEDFGCPVHNPEPKSTDHIVTELDFEPRDLDA